MGFFNGLANIVGQLCASAQGKVEQVNLYRRDYENLSNEELIYEAKKLSKYSSEPYRTKLLTIRIILKERNVSI